MNNNKFFLVLTVAVALAATIVVSCNKKFDEPPFTNVDPNITVNSTIKALKARHTVSGAYDDITTDVTISGIVIADDKSGNIYKQLYIQDTTGAITLLLDANSIYGTFPVGRRIFVKCKGLTVTDNSGMIQLGIKATINGSPSVEGIPATIISKYVTGGSFNNAVEPKQVTVSQLGTNMQDPYLGSLIQLSNYEFGKGDTTKTYSDTSQFKSTINRTINNCSGTAAIIIRTSAYANFAAAKLPSGNGTISAIYTTFGTTKQLILRDTSDVKFNTPRCNYFEEDFEAYSTGVLSINNWKNIGEVGNVSYTVNSFGGTKFAQATAFNSAGNPPVVTSWLITPAIALTGLTTANLSFQTIDGFNNGATLTVLVSTNYNGSTTPSTATWTTLASSTANPTLFAGPTTSGYASAWRTATINLASYIGQTVYFAFRYDGANPASGTRRTTTWEIDNVKITK